MAGREGKQEKGPERVGRLLEQVLGQAGPLPRPESLAAVSCWPRVAGARLARVSRAVSLRDGRLFVEVRSPAWKQELLLVKRQLIRTLNQTLGQDLVSEMILTVRDFPDGDNQ